MAAAAAIVPLATPPPPAVLLEAAAARAGTLPAAGFAIAIVSLVAGVLATAFGPWLYTSARPWDRPGLLNCCCCCGGHPVVLTRAVLTAACAAWFIFVVLGTVVQTFAEETCAAHADVLAAADLGTDATACVALVRLLAWEDQRALALGAYLSAAIMSALVLDARITNVLMATGSAAVALVLLGGDRALPNPHERAAVAVTLGLVVAFGWGMRVTSRMQAVVDIGAAEAAARRRSAAAAATGTKASPPPPPSAATAASAALSLATVGAAGAMVDAVGGAAAAAIAAGRDPADGVFGWDGISALLVEGDEAAAAALQAYGDGPAHVRAFVLAGSISANLAAWLLYYDGDAARRGWPTLVAGNAAHTWTAVVPGLLFGLCVPDAAWRVSAWIAASAARRAAARRAGKRAPSDYADERAPLVAINT